MEEILEIIKVISDIGISGCIMGVILWVGFKYLPKFIELKLKRVEEKDYMMDSFKSVIENNSQVINNNSEVIKLNSTTIKNYTDNSHKLEDHIQELTHVVNEMGQQLTINNEILKERRYGNSNK